MEKVQSDARANDLFWNHWSAAITFYMVCILINNFYMVITKEDFPYHTDKLQNARNCPAYWISILNWQAVKIVK